jgi:hypothetical protein
MSQNHFPPDLKHPARVLIWAFCSASWKRQPFEKGCAESAFYPAPPANAEAMSIRKYQRNPWSPFLDGVN